jgi:hypothetical protein
MQMHPGESRDSAKRCEETQRNAKHLSELQNRYSRVRFPPAPLCGVMTYGLRCIGVPSLRLQDRYSTALIRSASLARATSQFVLIVACGEKVGRRTNPADNRPGRQTLSPSYSLLSSVAPSRARPASLEAYMYWRAPRYRGSAGRSRRSWHPCAGERGGGRVARRPIRPPRW